MTADVALLHASGTLLDRRVAFQPLGEDALHCVGVLAFVTERETSAPDQRSDNSEAAELHRRLWMLRRDAVWRTVRSTS